MNTLTFKDSAGKTRRIGYELANPGARPPKHPKSWEFVPEGDNLFRFEDGPGLPTTWKLKIDGVAHDIAGRPVLNVSRFPRLARLWARVRKAVSL